MNIVILNTHSVLNSGDAAIVAAQVGVLRELLGDPRIVVTSRTPELDRGFYDRLGAQVIPPLFPAPSVFAPGARKLIGCACGLVSVRDRRRLVAELRRADLVISSGGGYLFSTRRRFPGPMFWQAFLQVRLAQRLGKPIVMAPQSIGPFADRFASRSMKRLLSHGSVRAILLREPISLQFVERLLGGDSSPRRASLCPDLAFLLGAGSPNAETAARPAAPGRPVLAVTVRDWLFSRRRGAARNEARTAYLDAVAEVCIRFHRKYSGSVMIFAQARGPGLLEDDRRISHELAAMLRSDIAPPDVEMADLPEDASPEKIIATLRGADLLLASRFHSAILAMTAGRPAIALGYQPKSEGMMGMLGLERFCLPMDGLEPSRLHAIIDEVLADPARFVAERVRPAVAAARTEIRKAMRIALGPFLPA